MFYKWAQIWEREDPFKYTKVIHNYAATNLIPRHLGPEYVIHGAKCKYYMCIRVHHTTLPWSDIEVNTPLFFSILSMESSKNWYHIGCFWMVFWSFTSSYKELGQQRPSFFGSRTYGASCSNDAWWLWWIYSSACQNSTPWKPRFYGSLRSRCQDRVVYDNQLVPPRSSSCWSYVCTRGIQARYCIHPSHVSILLQISLL